MKAWNCTCTHDWPADRDFCQHECPYYRWWICQNSKTMDYPESVWTLISDRNKTKQWVETVTRKTREKEEASI